MQKKPMRKFAWANIDQGSKDKMRFTERGALDR